MKTVQETLAVIKDIESKLGSMYSSLEDLRDEQQPYNFQEFFLWNDSRDACVDMVQGQVMEAWSHAGKAYKRLIALRDKEISYELEKLHGSK